MEDAFRLSGLRRLLRSPFAMPDAQNRFLLGSALWFAGAFVPILPGLAVNGYLVRVMRNAIRGEAAHLPPWEGWSELLIDGLKATVIGLAYLLPGLLVFVTGFMAYFFLSPVSMIFLGLTRSRSDNSGMMLASIFLGMLFLFLGMAVGSLLTLLGTIPLPVALARFVDSGRLADAFSVRVIWRLIRGDAWSYLTVWVVVMGLIAIVYALYSVFYMTMVLCAIGLIILAPGAFYAAYVAATAFGDFYRQRSAASSPAPIAPVDPPAAT